MNSELTRDEVLELLTEVGAILDAKGLTANIYVVGGVAMSLTLDSRRTTRDVDALSRDHAEELRLAAAQVGERHGLDAQWFDGAAKMFTTFEADHDAGEMSLPGLQVGIVSPKHLLAMKLRALRGRDMADLERLFTLLRIDDPQQAADMTNALFDDSYPGWYGEQEALYAAEDVFRWAERQGRPIGGQMLDAETLERAGSFGGGWKTAAEEHAGDRHWVEPHERRGKPVRGFWRNNPKRS